MLSSLTIQNVVLIERLTLEGQTGLCALTGETGAGKSILLDALGLALGARAEAGIVRKDAEQAAVTAVFDLPPQHPARALLSGKDIPFSESLILRRTVAKDGRSKAFINDAPVSVQLLKETGALLVEVHGQFETQGLLDPATHIRVLDEYAGLLPEVGKLGVLWSSWSAAKRRLAEADADAQALRMQEDYLKHAVAELEKLSPQEGEDAVLAEKRQRLQAAKKMAEQLDEAATLLDGEEGLVSISGRLKAVLDRLSARTGGDVSAVMAPLDRARAELEEASFQLGRAASGGGKAGADERLEDIEERYFALRECARKHRCQPDDLPRLWQDMTAKLRLVTDRDAALADLTAAENAARADFLGAARKISDKRAKVAQKLAKAVNGELPALKLDKARFDICCAQGAEERTWSAAGIDAVHFAVSTNPGSPSGPLHKIASGGELSRFMLALKVVLAETGSVPTLIFDEADSGIGGATADAVGERLQKLGRKYQVLAVTHSPQVAARAAHHWHVAKTVRKGATFTEISPLGTQIARAEEIARMLSGAEVTKEARAQAEKLLEKHDAAA